MLTDKQIKEFQDLFNKRFGYEISAEEACKRGMKLITLIKAIYKPLT